MRSLHWYYEEWLLQSCTYWDGMGIREGVEGEEITLTGGAVVMALKEVVESFLGLQVYAATVELQVSCRDSRLIVGVAGEWLGRSPTGL